MCSCGHRAAPLPYNSSLARSQYFTRLARPWLSKGHVLENVPFMYQQRVHIYHRQVWSLTSLSGVCGGLQRSVSSRSQILPDCYKSAQESTMNVIEWPVLCQFVAGFAQTTLEQRACLQQLAPATTEQGALAMALETLAVQIMQEDYVAEIDFGGIQTAESEESLKRVNRGGMLNGSELLSIATLVKGAAKIQRKIRDCASQAEELGELDRLGAIAETFSNRLGDLPGHVAVNIAAKIDESGHVKESASDDVRKALGKVRTLENRLRGILKNSGDEIEEHGGRLCVVVSGQGRGPPKGSVTVGVKLGGSAYVIEPPAAVNINNDLINLKNELRIAEETVLWDLTRAVSKVEDVLTQCLSAIVWLDGVNARYRFGIWTSGTLVTSFSPFKKTGRSRRKKKDTADMPDEDSRFVVIRQLRHPLILANHLMNSSKSQKKVKENSSGAPQKRLPGWRKKSPVSDGNLQTSDDSQSESDGPVPIDIIVEQNTKGVIITGPNTGGKTASLKAMGLVCMMVKCGIPIPAEPPVKIPCFDAIFADIGDEQSLSSSLSTFSGHLKRIESLRKESTGKSLVLLDELGTGTDAIDGAALGIALMHAFAFDGPGGSGLTMASTHHNALTSLKYDHPGIYENASVEFDEVNLQPTYKLIWGVPGRSCALNIAERLNIDKKITQKARALLGRDASDVDAQVVKLESLRKEEDGLTSEIQKLIEQKNKTENSIKKLRYVSCVVV